LRRRIRGGELGDERAGGLDAAQSGRCQH
jgi:hypothetical protein